MYPSIHPHGRKSECGLRWVLWWAFFVDFSPLSSFIGLIWRMMILCNRGFSGEPFSKSMKMCFLFLFFFLKLSPMPRSCLRIYRDHFPIDFASVFASVGHLHERKYWCGLRRIFGKPSFNFRRAIYKRGRDEDGWIIYVLLSRGILDIMDLIFSP